MDAALSSSPTWFYIDSGGQERGPFGSMVMLGWYRLGYFPAYLMVRRNIHSNFTTLSSLALRDVVEPIDNVHPESKSQKMEEAKLSETSGSENEEEYIEREIKEECFKLEVKEECIKPEIKVQCSKLEIKAECIKTEIKEYEKLKIKKEESKSAETQGTETKQEYIESEISKESLTFENRGECIKSKIKEECIKEEYINPEMKGYSSPVKKQSWHYIPSPPPAYGPLPLRSSHLVEQCGSLPVTICGPADTKLKRNADFVHPTYAVPKKVDDPTNGARTARLNEEKKIKKVEMADWQQDGWSNYNQQNWNTAQSDPTFQGQDFQHFDYGQQYGQESSSYGQESTSYGAAPPATESNSYLTGGTEYTGAMFIPDSTPTYGAEFQQATNEFDGEPPLLEELGINPDHILQKTLAVLNPLGSTQAVIAGDADLAGPLCFCLAFGSLLMFSGKLHFNYIYGIGLLGCLAMYGLLNLMALSGVSFGTVVSVLGYCLLPIVGLSALSVLFSLTGILGNMLTGAAILWCTVSASKLFVTALDMRHQQLLVAYPCAMLYGVFALITMF